jgi:hypothetical protein
MLMIRIHDWRQPSYTVQPELKRAVYKQVGKSKYRSRIDLCTYVMPTFCVAIESAILPKWALLISQGEKIRTSSQQGFG